MSCVRAPARNQRRGATLVELLVVIALIALLVTILIPSLSRSMEMASATVCKHNLREIGTSLHTYRMDNDGWLPVVVKEASSRHRVQIPDPWFLKLYPTYLGDAAALACPDDPFRYRLERAAKKSAFSEEVRADYSSYGVNSFIFKAGDGMLTDRDRRSPSRPHNTILVADQGPDVSGSAGRVAGVVGPWRNFSLLPWDDGYDPYDPFARHTTASWLTDRHHGGIHVLTLEGHVWEAKTSHMIDAPLQRYYRKCAAGGCTFCNQLRTEHYSFADDDLYWWTGPTPVE